MPPWRRLLRRGMPSTATALPRRRPTPSSSPPLAGWAVPLRRCTRPEGTRTRLPWPPARRAPRRHRPRSLAPTPPPRPMRRQLLRLLQTPTAAPLQSRTRRPGPCKRPRSPAAAPLWPPRKRAPTRTTSPCWCSALLRSTRQQESLPSTSSTLSASAPGHIVAEQRQSSSRLWACGPRRSTQRSASTWRLPRLSCAAFKS
mmetsp:Transcript_12259/g.47320  ORF Transcript_12259/g.47320 Transcript_12259/m.47320 type:complete len:200 (+) Transcript_12259:539-1138(+)